MKDPLQQSNRNIAPPLYLAEIGQLFKMDYSAVSQAAKRFEQKSKDNHKIGKIKQKMMAVLKENFLNFTWYCSIIFIIKYIP